MHDRCMHDSGLHDSLLLLLDQIDDNGQVVAIAIEPYAAGTGSLWTTFIFSLGLEEIITTEDLVLPIL